MKSFLPALCILLIAAGAVAQTHSYSIRNYKPIDGLPQSQVNIMLEDRNGYLWIGTHGGGLARFDGRGFKVYTTLDGLLSNIVTYLKLDSRQNLWVIHPRGISRFDGVTFKTFNPPGSPVNAKRIWRAFELQDTLFFISPPGHLGKIFRDSVYYWSKAAADSALIGYSHLMPDKSILLYRKDSTFQVKSVYGDYIFNNNNVFARLFGAFNYQNKVWLTTDKGRFTIDFSKRRLQPAQLSIDNHILYVDSVNEVFWTRRGNALIKEKLGVNNADTVLKDVEVTQILVDSEGNTWFATHGMGLYKYFIQDFDRRGPPDLNVVMAIHRDSYGATWVGSTTKGLWRMKDGKFRSYFSKHTTYRNEVFCIAESPDHVLWVGRAMGSENIIAPLIRSHGTHAMTVCQAPA